MSAARLRPLARTFSTQDTKTIDELGYSSMGDAMEIDEVSTGT
jgi:hypothetical protein